MKDAPNEFEQIQHWMQTVITHPGGIGAGVSSAGARQSIDVAFDELEKVVTRSLSLTGAERLAIYGRSYYARLLECFKAEYPCLLHALGEELFNRFVFEYLQHYPPRSYTLNRLAEDFPRFLAETRPQTSAARTELESWPDFIIDLATFERAFSETFNGHGVEGQRLLNPEQVLSIPASRFPLIRLASVPCLRLLTFRYPVAAYFLAVRKEQQPDLPAPADAFVAMTRQNYMVRFFDLSPVQYELLRALLADISFSEAVVRVAGLSNQQSASLFAKARAWLRDWAAAGFFQELSN